MSTRHASDLKIVPPSVRLQIIGNGGSSVIFFGNVLDAARAPTGTRVCVKIASSEAGKRQLRPRGSAGRSGEDRSHVAALYHPFSPIMPIRIGWGRTCCCKWDRDP